MNRICLCMSAALMVAVIASDSSAQNEFRDPLSASTGILRTSGNHRQTSVGNALVVSPRELLASDPANGLAATPNLAYGIWVETTTIGYDVKFRRSTTGGYTWESTQTIYQQTGAATWDFEQLDIAATNHEVYVAMSTAGPNAVWPDRTWVIASDDQGQTWSNITEIGVNAKLAGQGSDSDSIRIAAHSGQAHIVFHWADGANNNVLNDIWYVNAKFQNGALTVAPDVWLNQHQPNQHTEGVRYFEVAADGPMVAVCYTSPRVGSANQGNLYVVSDTSFGSTFGNTAVPKKISNYSVANPRTDQYWEPQIVCTTPNIYLTWCDNQNWPNNVFFTASNDLGQTFGTPVNMNPNAAGFDADSPVLAADGSLVCVAWHDDRDGNGNLGNRVFLAVDDTAGQGFLANTINEVRVDDPGVLVHRIERPDVDVKGDNIVVVYEKSLYDATSAQNEDLVVIDSRDRGQTWSAPRYMTTISPVNNGTADVDNPNVRLTQNGDAIVYWADDALGGNILKFGGFKLPDLVPLGNNQGLVVEAGPQHANNAVFVLVTEKSTAPPFVFDNMGNQFNFEVGNLTTALLGQPFLIAPADLAGKAAFPLVPDSRPWGVYLMAAGFDSSTGGITFFTDPLRY